MSASSTVADPQAPTANPRVLLVDDEILLRSFTRMLAADGFDVDARSDAEAAIEAVRTNTYEVVLSDIDMPRINGQLSLERRPRSSVPVVTISPAARRDRGSRQRCAIDEAQDTCALSFATPSA